METNASAAAGVLQPTQARTRLRITVLRGGPSAERAVSLESGAAVAAALRRMGHDVHEADISPDDLSALEKPCDIVFPVLHGTFGEDGQLQALLEQRGLRFVGCDAGAAALTIDKLASKQAVAAAGIRTPEYEVVTARTMSGVAQRWPGPVVVKPLREGSSVDTFILRDGVGLDDAVRTVVSRHERALVERCILGDEATVGLLAGEPLPVIFVRPKRAFYDYAAKYQDDATEYLFDVGQPAALHEELQALSRRVFDVLGARHLARIDWMMDQDGRPWFLELNAIPGFTSHSLVPKAAAKIGISFDELCDRLARMPLADAGSA